MDLTLDKLDTSKCYFNPKDRDILAQTSRIKEFNYKSPYQISTKSIIRYVILMYDAASPLWREVRSLPLRKAVAMELAGVERNREGRFPMPFEKIMEGKNQDVNAMLVKYLSLQNSPNWTRLCVYENLYYMETAKVFNGAYGKTNEVITAIDKLSASISQITTELVGGVGEATPILDAIYKEASKDLDLSPEKISKYIEEMGNVPEDWNPYMTWKDNEVEDEYKVDEIKFAGSK